MARLKVLNYCASIVGTNGSGKSILLAQLAPKLAELGFEPHLFSLSSDASMRDKERLPERLRSVRAPGFILLDGAEQLSTRHWLPVRSAASQAAGFVVTVHRTSRLPTLIECETNAGLLEALVLKLSGASLPLYEASTLVTRHHGSIREALSELRERWIGE